MYDRITIRHPHPYEDFITINETKQLPDTEQSRKVPLQMILICEDITNSKRNTRKKSEVQYG